MADLAIAFARVGSPGEDPFDLEGDLLDGQIRIGKVVGEGELSVVYRGLHEGMNEPVAIKCLNLPETLDPELVEPISESFREGARVHYRLAQGNLHIVQTLALGTTLAPRTGQQIPYVVREWLDGQSLANDFAARARAKMRPRASARAVELLDSAADAIAHAHAEGVCHHALSPRNLFLAKSQRREVLKVLDFGLAREGTAQSAAAGLRLLSSHAAPEQLDRRIGTPCPATDVFAFALVLFEAVTGRPYFAPGAHVSEVLRVAESRAPLSRRLAGDGVPRDLESVLARALALAPRQRHANLRVFWDEVKRAVHRVSPSLQVPPKPRLSTEPAAPRPRTGEAPAPPASEVAAAPDVAPASAVAAASATTTARPEASIPTVVPPPLPVFATAPASPPISVPAARPSPSSSTIEVAPPVTTSVTFPSAPAMTSEVGPALERDTVPADPPPEAGAERASIPMLSLRAHWNELSLQMRAHWNVLAAQTRAPSNAVVSTERRTPIPRSPFAGLRITVLATVPLALIVLFLAVLVGRTVRQDKSVAAASAREQRTTHAVAHETSALVLPETTLRVAPKLTAFDRPGAKRLFDETAADLESCTRNRGPRGPGSVRVIIHPSGKVLRLQIGPPYAGTSTGACISSRFAAMPIPAFVGPSQAMNYSFYTIPFVRP